MSLPSDTVSGASMDVVQAPTTASPEPAQPGKIARLRASDASAHVPGDGEEQRSIGIAAARGGDSEAWISKAGGVNEASQVSEAQSRPSSSKFVLGSSVNSFSADSVKVSFDGSFANASGSSSSSTSANSSPEASVQPPVFRGALPLSIHANEGNSTPVGHTNAGFLPQSQFGGNLRRFNNNNGRYRNQRYHKREVHGSNGHQVFGTNPHMWMSMPSQQGHGQLFIAPRPPAGPTYAFMPHQAPSFASPIGYAVGTSPYYVTPPAAFETYYARPPPFLETYYARPPPFLETYYARPPPPLETYYARPPPPSYQMPHAVSQEMAPAMVVDEQLALKKQIEYYFSVDNLCSDVFLRCNMDAQGWVPISLIATFRRVKSVTSNTDYILNALRSSTVIEIEGENIRRRNDWTRWLLPSAKD